MNYSLAEQLARQEINSFLKSALPAVVPLSGTKSGVKNLKPEITYPPKPEWGNFSVPCFGLGKNPVELAKNLAAKFNSKKYKLLKKVQPAGPYLNFFVDEKKYTELVLSEILKNKEKYGQTKPEKKLKIMVEYFSPNTNKPMTVGHLRNICLGEAVSNLLENAGHKVLRACLYNDRGIALCKTIVAYQKWGGKKTPGRQKPDHFAGQFYVMFNQVSIADKKLEDEATACLRKWEAGDKPTIALWKKILNWTLAGFTETLKSLELKKIGKIYFESAIYAQGRDLIAKGLKGGVFKKHLDGYIYAPLEQFGLPNKILLRADGTSLYIVQDIYLAILKNKDKLNKSIYIVGSEQDLAMKQLYKILEMLGQNFENYHLSYGMMRLPDGKIKSRQGLVKGTGADELIASLDKMALQEVKSRDKKISPAAAKTRARQIALAALKYYILQVNPKSGMIFDPKKSLAFTGNTGPYLQYTYARIASILKKIKSVNRRRHSSRLTGSPSEAEENALITTLAKFPAVCDTAATQYDPSLLAHYLYNLAKTFSAFYENVPVLKAEKNLRDSRLALIIATQLVMKKGLSLLGINAIEKM